MEVGELFVVVVPWICHAHTSYHGLNNSFVVHFDAFWRRRK